MLRRIFLNQQGFTLIELMVVISILGILSMVAVPKFSNSIALANTAKIQTDLQTIDTAIAMYQAQNGKYPQNIATDLQPYLLDADKLAPPQGKCLVKGSITLEITDTVYKLNNQGERAVFQEHVSTDFGR